MRVSDSDRETIEVAWTQGELEVNLIPMNRHLSTNCYCSSGFDGSMITAQDNVGIVALQLRGCPPVPRICWDNREHHFWRGFSGSFTPRNTVVNDIAVRQSADEEQVTISCYYIADFVKTTMTWSFSEPQCGALAQWDTALSFENLSEVELVDYMAFFACYHQAGQNYHCGADGELSPCADSFQAYPGDEERQRVQTVTAAFQESVKGWTGPCENPTRASAFFHRPILSSASCEWFADGRHLFLVEPGSCASIVSAMTQARDYMLAPPQRDLPPGGSFTARVRHVIAEADRAEDLNPHWDAFDRMLQED